MKLHQGLWRLTGDRVGFVEAAGDQYICQVLGENDTFFVWEGHHAVVSPVLPADEDPDQYQQAALSTVRDGVDVELMCAVGLAGEVGEVCEPIKKHRFHGKTLDREAQGKELGDVLWYLSVLANFYGFKLSTIMRDNREKLAARYAEMKAKRAAAAQAEEAAAAWVREHEMAGRGMASLGEKILASNSGGESLNLNGTSPETPDATVDVAEDGSGRTLPVDRTPNSAGPGDAPSTPTEGSRNAVGLTAAAPDRDDAVIDGTGKPQDA